MAGLVDEKVQQNLGLKEELSARVSELERIKASRSWKVALFLREMRSKVAPVDGILSKQLAKVNVFGKSRLLRFKKKRREKLDIRLIRQTQIFDKNWYLENNPDVEQAGIDPVTHFYYNGAYEGRMASPKFDSAWYLNKYTDVKENGINPLIHYLRFGKKEGRLPIPNGSNNKAVISLVGDVNVAEQNYKQTGLINTLDQQKNEDEDVIINAEQANHQKEQVFSDSSCTGRINEYLEGNRNRELIIAFSHDDYLHNVGGVQIKVADQQVLSNVKNKGYLHIYPYFNSAFLVFSAQPLFVGVNIEGQSAGVLKGDELIDIFRQHSSFITSEIQIHHTMGFEMQFILKFLREIRSERVKFWLHDLFSICPNYLLLRNDLEYCHAPSITSNACTICRYRDLREKHLQAFDSLFREFEPEIIAPSDHILSLWKEKTEWKTDKCIVEPHARIIWEAKKKKSDINQKTRVAFVGIPVKHKGWDMFRRLTETLNDSIQYEFFLFSSVKVEPGNFKQISVTVNKEDRLAMKNALSEHDIDVTILWSICPESFSYTLYESIAAGCLVITNPFSGNIQAYIRNHPDYGMIFKDEKELIECFVSNQIVDLVRSSLITGKPVGNLIFPHEDNKKDTP
jgi:hypothetical protein